MTSVYRQIGNAVPYPLAKAIASEMYNGVTGQSSINDNKSEKKESLENVMQLEISFS